METSNTLFVYDGWNLIQELDGNDPGHAVQKSYVWGLDLSQSIQGAGGVGGLLAMTENGNTYLYCHDANGNVGRMINATDGSVAAAYEYAPFGSIVHQSDGAVADDNPFRFSTKYHDTETGLYYYGYRYYSTELGRWLNRDPLEEEGALNLYLFVNNNPINSFDPLGEVDYDVDSQGFHVRLDTKSKVTFRVEFDEEGNYTISEKPGETHKLTQKQLDAAKKQFDELIKDPVEQAKMKDAVVKRHDMFKNKEFPRSIGRNLRRTISRINRAGGRALGIAGYILMFFDLQDAQNRAEECNISVWAIMIENMGFNVVVVDAGTGKVIYETVPRKSEIY